MTNSGVDRPDPGWTVDGSTFGARLALIRWRKGWNVKEAAKLCGLPAASWRSWEEGAQPRRLLEVAGLIAARTGCDYGWLVMGTSPHVPAGTDGPAIAPYLELAERPTPAGRRPPDNRPPARPDPATTNGVRRTVPYARIARRSIG